MELKFGDILRKRENKLENLNSDIIRNNLNKD